MTILACKCSTAKCPLPRCCCMVDQCLLPSVMDARVKKFSPDEEHERFCFPPFINLISFCIKLLWVLNLALQNKEISKVACLCTCTYFLNNFSLTMNMLRVIFIILVVFSLTKGPTGHLVFLNTYTVILFLFILLIS